MKVYAVDFDGLLCEDAWPEIGKPKHDVIERCKALKAEGHKLILWTCREDEKLHAAVVWCWWYGLRFDAINDNLPERKKQYGNNCRKVGADYYIDDKNLFWEEVNK